MSLEGQSWRDVVVSTIPVIHSVVLSTDGKLRAYRYALVVRNLGHIPCCIAGRVAVVAALLLICSPVEIPMEIHLFSGVVLVDEFSASLKVIDTVLDGVDAAGHWVLTNTHAVPQTPSKEQTIVYKAVAVRSGVRNIKSLDCRDRSSPVKSPKINVGSTASTHQQHARRVLAEEERACNMSICRTKVSYDFARVRCRPAL